MHSFWLTSVSSRAVWWRGGGCLSAFCHSYFQAFSHSISPYFFPLSNLISFDGCLERGLMTEMWGFSIHENGILSKDWLAKLRAPGYPGHPPFACVFTTHMQKIIQWFTSGDL